MSTEDTTTKPSTATSKVTLRPKQWAIAEALWHKGEATADDLAKRFGVHRTTVKRHMSAKGIIHGAGAEETRRKVAEAVESAVDDDAAVTAARIKETKDDHYKMASGLAKLAWNEVLKAKAEGLPISAAQSNLKALDTAMSVMVKARTERWAILGQDRPDAVDSSILPGLNINVLTPEKIEELQNRDFNPYDEDQLKPDDDEAVARDPQAREQDDE